VVGTLTTDGSGTVTLGGLAPGQYCLEETAAPDGYELAPTYSPDACAAVAADPTQGKNPTAISVADTPKPTPSPTAPPPTSSGSRLPRLGPPSALSAVAVASRAMIAVGALLLLGGLGMVAVALRRRRLSPGLS
jgi:hypothetical protein